MGANGAYFTQAKVVSAGVFKEMHSLVRDDTDRKRVHIKQNQQTQNA